MVSAFMISRVDSSSAVTLSWNSSRSSTLILFNVGPAVEDADASAVAGSTATGAALGGG